MIVQIYCSEIVLNMLMNILKKFRRTNILRTTQIRLF